MNCTNPSFLLWIVFANITLMVVVASGLSHQWIYISLNNEFAEMQGLYFRCTPDHECFDIQPISDWRFVALILNSSIQAILASLALIQILSLCYEEFQLPRVCAFFYAIAAILAIGIIIIFPWKVVKLGLEMNGHKFTWLSWSFYIFIIGAFLLVAMTIECFLIDPNKYPEL
ncbi:unnamed protein product [Lymnaea stagnalis]|uniref:Uncharacterized protein n=1 Tax=Lymnaea stagnalis TaxID=6523 RepID=A0AAV2HG93_LYMST